MNRDKLLSIYDGIQELKEKQKEHMDIVSKLDNKIQNEILEYRIASVSRVLDYIHTKQFEEHFDKNYFDTLITHCCNKLNGNLDGIELDLKGDNND